MRSFFDAHGGDLILAVFAITALIAYTAAVMLGHADQTLGNIAIGGLGALGGYMSKRTSGTNSSTTNVDTAENVAVNPAAGDKTGE